MHECQGNSEKKLTKMCCRLYIQICQSISSLYMHKNMYVYVSILYKKQQYPNKYLTNKIPQILSKSLQKMRNRSPSPIQTYQNQQVKKYYTREQVSQILQTMFQTKLSQIYKQLQDKQQIIRKLNQKLNSNDLCLQQNLGKMYQLQQYYTTSYNQIESTKIEDIVNRLLNQKLQEYWHFVQNQLQKIRSQTTERSNKFYFNVQNRNDAILAQIKKACEDGVQNFKKKNNGYWVKVKEALNKINAKTVQSEEKMGNIGLQISKYETEREQNGKAIRQIQNGKNTAKMLVQLKKSVNNVYKNFQQVLKLQKNIKQSYQKMGSIDKWNIQSNKPQWNQNHNKNLNSKQNTNKPDDIVILQYSVEEDTLSNHQANQNQYQLQQNKQNKQEQVFRPQSKSMALRNSSPSIQYNMGKNQGQGDAFPGSPITGKVIENSNYSHPEILIGSERYKNTHQTAVTSTSMKNQTYQWTQSQDYLNHNNFLNEVNRHDKSQSFQLAPHNNSQALTGNPSGNSRVIIGTGNAVSTSMLNFSLQCRKQTIQSVRPRLLDMIQTKGLVKPLRVYLDQINYLKNQDGNYLFDLKGNMFKLTPMEFSQLERDKIVAGIKIQDIKKNKK